MLCAAVTPNLGGGLDILDGDQAEGGRVLVSMVAKAHKRSMVEAARFCIDSHIA